MKYLGIRYLKNWAKEKLEIKESFEYGKYRGDEWLKGETVDIFCIQGKLINISIYSTIDGKQKEAERRSYYLEKEKWILRYHRVGKDVKIYK